MTHSLGLWLYYNAQTIQAVAAILGVIGLAVYARDTKLIRIATLRQSDASRRPYFHVEDWENKLEEPAFVGRDFCQFKNCGSGIAHNVCWRFLNDNASALMPLGSCGVGRVKYLFTPAGHWTEYEEIENAGGVYLEYDDTAGVRYWTTITITWMNDKTVHLLVDTGSRSK